MKNKENQFLTQKKIDITILSLNQIISELKSDDLTGISYFYNIQGHKIIKDLLTNWNTTCSSTTEIEAKNLIKEFFFFAGKEFDVPTLAPNRAKHMITAYLLGIWFYNNFSPVKNAINSAINYSCNKTNERNSDEEIFLYVWFLICLGHDLKSDSELSDLSDTEKRGLDILHENVTLVPIAYRNCVKDYLKLKKGNHGIIGGIELFIKIKKEFDDHCPLGKWWNTDTLTKDASIACWAIICHNFWYASTPESCKEYKKNNLDFLLPCQDPHITLDEHPFLFLFSIIDTLEPQKHNVSLDERFIVFKRHECFGSDVFKKSNSDISGWLKLIKKKTHQVLPLYYFA